MVSIRGYSAYVPLYRIERASIAEQHGAYEPAGEVSVPAHDENVLTMASKVTKDALSHAGGTDDVDAIFTATTSDPFDERGLASQVAVALGADPRVRVADFQGSPRSATNALLAARDVIAAEQAETVLVIASDLLQADEGSTAEQTSGAGAGAVVLGAGGDVATLTGSASRTTAFIGRFEPTGESPVEGDGRFNRRHGYRETVTPLLDELDPESTSPVATVLPAYSQKWPGRALRNVEFEFDQYSTFNDVGYVGAASAFLDLALALDSVTPGTSLLLASYGPGGSDALRFECGDGVETERETPLREYIESKQYVSYVKHQRYRSWNQR